MSQTIRIERMPGAWPALTAVLVFSLALVAVGVAVGLFLVASTGAGLICVPGAVILSVPVAYLISRNVYMAMRWKKVDNSDGRYCGNCSYDLTGNSSGQCPECGVVIGVAIPPQGVPKD